MKLFIILFSVFFSSLFSSCASYQTYKHITEEAEMPIQIYRADYNQTWQALMDVLVENNLTDFKTVNMENGIIKTRWVDNTMETNFINSFGDQTEIKSAKFKMVITVTKVFRGGKEVTRVVVFKRQLVEQDFLQGYKELPSDGIMEKVILYRLQKKIEIDQYMRDVDRQKEQEKLQSF